MIINVLAYCIMIHDPPIMIFYVVLNDPLIFPLWLMAWFPPRRPLRPNNRNSSRSYKVMGTASKTNRFRLIFSMDLMRLKHLTLFLDEGVSKKIMFLSANIADSVSFIQFW